MCDIALVDIFGGDNDEYCLLAKGTQRSFATGINLNDMEFIVRAGKS